MIRARKLILIVIAAGCFGVVTSLLKGQGGGVRLAFGNISAPWLLVAFLAGTQYRRLRYAALAGLLATLAALLGFYAEQSPLVELGSRSGDFIANPAGAFDFLVSAHSVYFLGGVVIGPIFGLLGGIWGQRRSRLAAGAVALAFVCEPVVVWALGGGVGNAGLVSGYLGLALAEAAIGIAGAVLIFSRTHASRGHESVALER
ncbi:MAG TPA: DUF6518 family protein [Solirubrobacteraceae bacterium]